jgi:hypothetical protein
MMTDKTIELTVTLTERQVEDLQRFHETSEDGQGYDVPAERMTSLARAGMIRSTGFSRYEFTDVGTSVIQRLSANDDKLGLDERLKAANLYSVAELLASGPLDGFHVHAGVHNLETFRQWLEMRRGEILRLQGRYDLGDRPKDELYEWVYSHTAAFSEVHINFKAAIASLAPAPNPTLN